MIVLTFLDSILGDLGPSLLLDHGNHTIWRSIVFGFSIPSSYRAWTTGPTRCGPQEKLSRGAMSSLGRDPDGAAVDDHFVIGL